MLEFMRKESIPPNSTLSKCLSSVRGAVWTDRSRDPDSETRGAVWTDRNRGPDSEKKS
jgi:hypothetical protein